VIAFTDTTTLRGNLKTRLENQGVRAIDFNKEIDFLVVKGDENNLEQKNLSESLGIPILSESYIMRSLPKTGSPTLTKRRNSTSVTPTRRSKRRRESFPNTVGNASESRKFQEIQALSKASVKESIAIQKAEQKAEQEAQLKLELEKELMNSVVALEGNIGVGKSTLCAKFKTVFPAKCSVYKEKANEKFLQLFYSDPKAYGFAFQWGMLKTRQYQLALAQHDTKFGRLPPRQFYFWDRSLIGDYIFALWNHLLGSISEKEMSVYEDEFGGSIKTLESISALSAINCFILLDDEPENCKYRVEKLRGNKSESDIPLSYYEGIDDIHFSLFVDHLMPLKLVKVLVLSWGQYNDPKGVWDLVLAVIGGVKEEPTVTNIQTLPEKRDPSHYIYTSTEDIMEFYNQIRFLRRSQEQAPETEIVKMRKNFETIFIPNNIMTINGEEKGVKKDNYNIRFYCNEFKRVVLWHLSQLQNVCFYGKEG